MFGSLGGTDDAPNFLNYGGRLARFRYDVLQHGPRDVPVLWAAPTGQVPVPEGGASTWVFFYHDNDQVVNPFPREPADRYLDASSSASVSRRAGSMY